ncbi:hypothetical protein B7489_03650 [Vibrio alginolyticus]|nr:hypothetical protein [Vibrio alginolyticus]MCQ9069563.1 hypothetical protein [Vibrio alginolyticus]OSP15822.1 hypothetical protein B7489_03650 [Vibrio alginolyticus]HDU8585854.1 hypothetical protein [Vibrio alginolyticus]
MGIRSILKLKFRSGAKLSKPNQRLYRFGSLVCDLTVPGGFYESNRAEESPEITRDFLESNVKNDYHNQFFLVERLEWPYHTIIPYPGTYDYYGHLIMKLSLVPYAKSSNVKKSLYDIRDDILFRYDDFYNAEEHDPNTGRGYNKHKIKSIYRHYNEEVVLGNEELRNELINNKVLDTLIVPPTITLHHDYIKYESEKSFSNFKSNYCFLFNEYCYLSIEFYHNGWTDRYMKVCLENSQEAENMIVSSIKISELLD